MKYFETLIEDQETIISVLYEEQIIKIYSSEPKTIQKLTKALGKPDVKYKKSKTYWSGANWNVNFFDLDKISQILNRDTFIDKKLKPIDKKENLKNKKKIKKDKLISEKKGGKEKNIKESKTKDTKAKNTAEKLKKNITKNLKINKESKKSNFEKIQFIF